MSNQSTSANPIALRASEVAMVKTIRENGPLSRTDLARKMGYSRANITGMTSGLLDLGLLKEVGPGVSLGGRRPVMLDINGDKGGVIGVDMGATSITVALANFSGQILTRHTEPVDVQETPETVLDQICKIAIELLEQYQMEPTHVIAVGIGVPGPVQFSRGVLIAPPLMPLWEGFPIKEFVRQTFRKAQVVVDNDVNVMSIGELYAGAGKGIDNFIFIKIGTGIGSGVICNGQIYRGSDGCAGDVGHICIDYNGPICHCGNAGCLEAMAAGPPIAARATKAALAEESDFLAQRLAENGTLTAKDVSEAAATGDRVANLIIQESGRMIGGMLASLVNFFNPRLILIGGGVSKIGFKLLSSIRQAVLRRSTALSTRDMRIDFSQLGNNAGVIGAIQLAIDHVFVVKGR